MGWGSGKRGAVDPEPDVKVHHTAGCVLCSRTDQHTHTQDEWRAMLDAKDGR